MSILLYLALAVIAIGIVIWVLILPKQGQESSNRPKPDSLSTPSSSPQVSIPQEVNEHVKTLLQANRTIEAIKIVREATGLGLKEAKDYLDSLNTSKDTLWKDEFRDELQQSVEELIIQGKTIDAIKLVRQKTGLGLKEANGYVNQIKRSIRQE